MALEDNFDDDEESSVPSEETLDFESTLAKAESYVTRTSTKLRRRLWADELCLCIKGKGADAIPTALFARTAALIFSTLHTYDAKSSRRAVELFLKTAVSETPNFGAFFGKFLPTASAAYCSNYQVNVHERARLTLMKWSCTIMEVIFPRISQAPALFSGLVSFQCSLLSGLLRAPKRRRAAAFSALLRVFKYAEAIEAFMKVAMSPDLGVLSCGMIGAVLHYITKRKDTQRMAALKGTFLDVYVRVIINSNVQLSKYERDPFIPLLRAVTHQDFSQTLLPSITRCLKRNPEIVIETAAHLALHLNLDMSQYVQSVFLAPVLAHIKASTGPDDSIRNACVALMQRLAKQSTDPAMVATCIQDVATALAGALPYWYQRAALSEIVQALSQVPTGKQTQDIASTAVAAMTAYIAKEGQEDAKIAGVAALAAWLWKLDKLPVDTLKLFAAGLRPDTKDGLRRAYLAALHSVLVKSDNARAQTASLVESLFQLLSLGATKPLHRPDALFAARTLLLLASGDSKIDERLKSDALWAVIVRRDGLGGDKLDVRELLLQSELIDLLLSRHSSRLNSADHSIISHLYATLAQLMVHAAWEVRKAALGVVNKNLNLHPSLSRHLVAALFAALRQHKAAIESTKEKAQADAAKPAAAAAPDKDKDKDKDKGEAPSARAVAEKARLAFTVAFFAALPESIGPDTVPTVVMAAHHPLLACPSEVARPHVWDLLLRKYRTDILSALPLVMDVIVGPSGLLSTVEDDRLAALRALRTLSIDAFEEAVPGILERVVRALEPAPIHDLSEYEMLVYNTPEGQLLEDVRPDSVGMVVEDKNKKRSKYQAKLYSAEEEEWERKVREEIERKKNAGKVAPEKAALEEMRKAQLERESAIRGRVAAVITKVDVHLQALRVMAATNPDDFHYHMHVVLPALLDLGNVLLTAPLVWRVMRDVSHCVNKTWRPFSALISLALQAVVCKVIPLDPTDFPKGNAEPLLQSLLSRLHHHSALAASPQSFALVFPVLQDVLTNISKHDIKLQDHAMFLLCLHAQTPDPKMPVCRMIHVLQHVLSELSPKMDARAREALFSVASIVEDDACIDQLLAGLLSKHKQVRDASLHALERVPVVRSRQVAADSPIAVRVWYMCFDSVPELGSAARQLWKHMRAPVGPQFSSHVMALLSHPSEQVRQCAALALAGAIKDSPSTSQAVFSRLFALYTDSVKAAEIKAEPAADKGAWSRAGVQPPPLAKSKSVDKPPVEETIDTWGARSGVALALKACGEVMTARDLPVLFTFLISRALGDPHDVVRQHMLQCALSVIELHGKSHVPLLLPIFENYLDKPAGTTLMHDKVREGVVICMAGLARHLDTANPKIGQIVDKLLETLRTPSESVQRTVATCLAPLMPIAGDAVVHSLINRLLTQLLTADRYADRRGAAFGLAGAVKGKGISALKQYEIMDRLAKEGIESKSSATAREGALFAYECFCDIVGRLFEPYVTHITPLILNAFSDAQANVRDAANNASRAAMANLTAAGVKTVLNPLLKSLDEKAWRVKQCAVELLGNMAYCAPQQLSKCLPQIVPRLIDVLGETHPKVTEAAQKALQHIGSVIRNPEIQNLVPVLLLALCNPNQHTKPALDALLNTAFVHTVDSPSLALIVPILHRGLRERSTDTKKKAAQIVGNMGSLITDHKDVEPYLPVLLPELRTVLLDPIPEARAIAAKALGTLMQGLGEDKFSDLLPWLQSMLKSETSPVERSGAAQGFAEVLAGLGMDKFDGMLPEIMDNMSCPKAHIREGYLGLFVFLPRVLGQKLQPYLARVLPLVLHGLADDSEPVREISLRVGRALVDNYAFSALELLLPAMEEGLFNDYWRIRHSSVQLLGDLLFRIAGTSGKVTYDADSDDEGISTEAHGQAITNTLGVGRRTRVLAALYMLRSDIHPTVRHTALHVWKTVVSNTPRTLRDILPTLMRILIDSLASDSSERRQVAGRSLGELVHKLGDRVLPDIVPILQKGLHADEWATRQGVCLGISEVMSASSRLQLLDYLDSFIVSIRTAICDSSSSVRASAAHAFLVLHRHLGQRAVDEVVMALMASLQDEQHRDFALDGLRNLLALRAALILPILLPNLTTTPMTAFNATALGSLADVAGPVLHSHADVLTDLIDSLAHPDPAVARAVDTAMKLLLEHIDPEHIHILVAQALRSLNDSKAHMRLGAVSVVGHMVRVCTANWDPHISNLLQAILRLFNDPDINVRSAAWGSLDNITKTIKKEDLVGHLAVVRETIRTVLESERRKNKNVVLPGFCVPKGIAPLLPMFLHALQFGSPEMREQAALGLSEIIDVTTDEALKPFVVQITGPLIRIMGDRFPWQVKAAMLQTLSLVISKAGIALKPFVPQLQTTFVKSLHETTKVVRMRAAIALGKLMTLNTRIDPLVNDLVNGVKNTDGGVQEAMLRALRGVLLHAGATVSPPLLSSISAAVVPLLHSEQEQVRVGAAFTMGVWARYAKDDELISLTKELVADDSSGSNWISQHGRCLAVSFMLKHAASRLDASLKLIVPFVKRCLEDDKAPMLEAACLAGSYLAVHAGNTGRDAPARDMAAALAALSLHQITDVRRAALNGMKRFAKRSPQGAAQHASAMVVSLLTCTKERNIPVRSAAERALYYIFQVKAKGMDAINAYVKNLEGDNARQLQDCARRVLTKVVDEDSEASADEAEFDEHTSG